jgi:pimeloyl-ACP methyl ester carboxylesterase
LALFSDFVSFLFTELSGLFGESNTLRHIRAVVSDIPILFIAGKFDNCIHADMFPAATKRKARIESKGPIFPDHLSAAQTMPPIEVELGWSSSSTNTLTAILDCGHYPHLELPDGFASLLRTHWAGTFMIPS